LFVALPLVETFVPGQLLVRLRDNAKFQTPMEHLCSKVGNPLSKPEAVGCNLDCTAYLRLSVDAMQMWLPWQSSGC
jgi:hypothetical protein